MNGLCSCINDDSVDAVVTTSPYERLATEPSNGLTVAEKTRRYNEGLWRQGVGRLWKFNADVLTNGEEKKTFRKGWEKLVKRSKMLHLKTPQEFSFSVRFGITE